MEAWNEVQIILNFFDSPKQIEKVTIEDWDAIAMFNNRKKIKLWKSKMISHYIVLKWTI